MSFFSLLEARVAAVDSLICVGLDPHATDLGCSDSATEKERADAAVKFCKRLVDETCHIAAGYKPNAAFFEALGEPGFSALHQVIDYIDEGIPVVLDAKRGDISSTAEAYAVAGYDKLKAHCMTLHPYMGLDSVAPFVLGKDGHKDRGAFVLCKTSNPSSEDFETLALSKGGLLYEEVARRCASWNEQSGGNVGLVVGATDVEAMRRSRAAAPELWILAPGVGFQGGNLAESVAAGLREDGSGLLIPISRGISRAASPKEAAEGFSRQVNAERAKLLGIKKQKVEECGGALADFQKDFFRLALRCGVLKFGEFTLKSGRKSPYFFNAGLFSTGSALDGLGRYYAERIVKSGVKFDVIFGPAYKGIPLGAVIAVSLHRDFGQDVPFAYNRKEAKDHGEGGVLVGASVKNKKVLVVDDVITAGTAIRESIAMLATQNATVAGVVIALDRQEKVSDTVEKSAIQGVKEEFGFDVFPIVALDDLLAFIEGDKDQGLAPEVITAVQSYRTKYGVSTK